MSIVSFVPETDVSLSNDTAKILDFSELNKKHLARLRRFASHKKRNELFADYLLSLPDLSPTDAVKFTRLRSCSSYLEFNHYLESDKIRLSGGNFCRTHLLCPMCAIRRAAKKVRAYYEKYNHLKKENPSLKLSYAVLTVANGEDLDERFRHVHKSVKKLLELRKHSNLSLKGQKKYDYAKDCSLRSVVAGAYSFEFKRGSGSNLWHPHCNLLMLSDAMISVGELSKDWESITGDSKIVYVKDKSHISDTELAEKGLTREEDEKQVFVEVFKYALKFSELDFPDNLEVYNRLYGRHLVGTFGAFWGLKVDEDAIDDAGDEPYIQLLYKYLDGEYRKEGRNELT
jgi:hypothetical protein